MEMKRLLPLARAASRQCASRVAARSVASTPRFVDLRALSARGFAASSNGQDAPPSPPKVQVLRHDHKPQASYVQVEEDIAAMQRESRDAYSAGNFQAALEIGLECRDLVKGHFGESHPVFASTITNIALMYKNTGQTEEAIESYEFALRVYKESVGENHASFATTLHNLGSVYQTLSHTVKGMERVSALHRAQDCFEESLKIRKLLLEPGHPDIALSMCNLGIIHWHNKQANKAVDMLKEALAMLETRVGKQSTLTALAMNNLAFVYKEARYYDQSIELYEQVVAVREAKWGPEHNETIMAKHNLSEAYRASGNEDKAVQIQNEILELFDVVDEDGEGAGSPDSSR